MYLVTYSETDSVKFNDANVYNARKLHIHANLYDAFAEDKKQHCCGDKFVNGQFCKRLSSTISEQDFNENSGEVFTEIYWPIAANAGTWLGIKDSIHIYPHFL